MAFVYICPSEAALTGLFLERYLYLAQHTKPVIVDVVGDYVMSFSPEFTRQVRRQIPQNEMPADVSFDLPDDSCDIRVGFPARIGEPNRDTKGGELFEYYELHTDGRVFHVKTVADCQSYADKLINFAYGRDIPESYAIDDNAWAEPEDPKTVAPRIEQLMKEFHVDHYFRIGRRFGEVFNAIEDASNDRLTADDLVKHYHAALKKNLLSIWDIWRNTTAACLLENASQDLSEHMLKLWAVASKGDSADLPPSVMPDEYGLNNGLYSMECMVWTAWGTVLGAMRESDEAEHQRHVGAGTHRLMKSVGFATAKALAEQLDESARQLASGVCKPKLAVLTLSNAIEFLVKARWPRYAKSREFSVNRILHDQIRSPDEMDRRFAQIAMALHNCYRNRVVHEWDSFDCTHQEAVLFLDGIRVLLEITTPPGDTTALTTLHGQ